jgi:hypothetical protein
LPIHDSYIVRDTASDKGQLTEDMVEALHRIVGDNNAPSNGYRKSIPQYGARPLPAPVGAFCAAGDRKPVGRIVMYFPKLSQRGQFGADTLAAPTAKIGVSRAQFENILQGRFGASESVASHICDFLIEGAKTVGTMA